jgi:hypothetical protein
MLYCCISIARRAPLVFAQFVDCGGAAIAGGSARRAPVGRPRQAAIRPVRLPWTIGPIPRSIRAPRTGTAVSLPGSSVAGGAGGADGIRTHDLDGANVALFPTELRPRSFGGAAWRVVEPRGVEPPTSRVRYCCRSHLQASADIKIATAFAAFKHRVALRDIPR